MTPSSICLLTLGGIMMNVFFSLIGQFIYDEAGVTVIEYGLITSLIALVLTGALARTGESVDCIATPATCS